MVKYSNRFAAVNRKRTKCKREETPRNGIGFSLSTGFRDIQDSKHLLGIRVRAAGDSSHANTVVCAPLSNDAQRSKLSAKGASMNKVLLAAIAITAGAPGVSTATDVGIGLSIKSNDATIYVPIDVSAAFRIEPSISYSENKTESGFTITENTNINLGVGFFGKSQVVDSIEVYYGGRVAYIESKAESSTSLPFPASSSVKSDGYRIAPTLGFQYFFNDHISLGGEVAWAHTDLDNVESSGTTTNAILRYKF
jgi:hypothetical protein